MRKKQCSGSGGDGADELRRKWRREESYTETSHGEKAVNTMIAAFRRSVGHKRRGMDGVNCS
jgi:hypothetical protein